MSLQCIHSRARRVLRDQEGSALIEFTIMAPLLLSLVLGISEFGRFLYQYQMVLEGLRDAGRYLARLDANDATNQTNAANLATTGTIDGSGDPRVDGWEAADIGFAVTDVDNTAGIYRGPAEIEVIEVTTTFDYADVGFLSALGFDPISIDAAHEQRVILE
ncbi:MAG TPA: TadE/TadG family type IV pilus assembly protein [Dongiaceae bacterium]|nr:TadE/TadG family type IV pilus assembly protein [Dongiaceae bacterium]